MVKSNDPAEKTTARMYRVQEDEDLQAIALRLYGVPDYWVFLYEANAQKIADNGGLKPGQVLLVPDVASIPKDFEVR
jgi:nucleoid-associated protein YgaU